MERSVRVEHPRFCTKSRMAMDEGEAGNVIFLANCTGTGIYSRKPGSRSSERMELKTGAS